MLLTITAASLAGCGDDVGDDFPEIVVDADLADQSVDATGAPDASAETNVADAGTEESSSLASSDARDAGPDLVSDAALSSEPAPVDAHGDCGAPGVLRRAPVLPGSIAVPPGVTLVAGYRASGSVFYACEALPDDGGAAWLSAPSATLYGDDCTAVAAYSFVGGNPTWTGLTGTSSVTARVDGVLWVSSIDSGSPNELPWLRFVSTMNPGAGILQNITYVQQVDTSGGLKPPMPCDPRSAAVKTVSVPYSATYYFYTGRPAPVAIDASPPASTDARIADTALEVGPVPTDASPDAPPTDASADASHADALEAASPDAPEDAAPPADANGDGADDSALVPDL